MFILDFLWIPDFFYIINSHKFYLVIMKISIIWKNPKLFPKEKKTRPKSQHYHIFYSSFISKVEQWLPLIFIIYTYQNPLKSVRNFHNDFVCYSDWDWVRYAKWTLSPACIYEEMLFWLYLKPLFLPLAAIRVFFVCVCWFQYQCDAVRMA